MDKHSSADPEMCLNLELLCARCSTDKNARSPQEWIDALARRFADEGGRPASDDRPADSCKVFFPVGRADLPVNWPTNIEGEVLWAQRVGSGSARILNTPFTIRNLSLFDVVNFREICVPEGVTDPLAADHYVQAESLAEHSGYGTLRADFDEPSLDAANDILAGAGDSSYARETGGGACAISVLQDMRLREVAFALQNVNLPGFRVDVFSTSGE